MEIELNKIYEKLENIRVSLRKLGPERRKENLGLRKVDEAKYLFSIYKQLLRDSPCSTQDYSDYIIEVISGKILDTYNKILTYSTSSIVVQKQVQMAEREKFSLKEASCLIPVLDGKQDTIERMIEGIEMMNSMLEEAKNKQLLISFILKTRLDKTSKLKLQSNYETVEALVSDIKKYLISKKSANSLLLQLNNTSQNEMSITEYGEKIEDLFIGLTIAQADNNKEAREILKPINESLAIKKFADGLKNRRLSTIIAARNYTQLKEAIQAAKDEELSQPSSSGIVMNMRGKSRSRGRQGSRFYYRRPQAAGQHYSRNSYRGHSSGTDNNFNRYNGNHFSNNFYRHPSSNGYRGRRGARGYRGQYQHRGNFNNNNMNQRAYTCTGQTNTQVNPVESARTEQVGTGNQEPDLTQFFRA